MATQAEIFDLRLKINDPAGFIAFSSVANAAALPGVPSSQTCYLQEDTGEYKATEKTDGAIDSDYTVQTLQLSDAVLSALFDSYGEYGATCKALQRIIGQLGKAMSVKSLSGGADSTEYQSLSDMYNLYKVLLDICKDETKSNAGTNTGRMFSTYQPEIAGGNL